MLSTNSAGLGGKSTVYNGESNALYTNSRVVRSYTPNLRSDPAALRVERTITNVAEATRWLTLAIFTGNTYLESGCDLGVVTGRIAKGVFTHIGCKLMPTDGQCIEWDWSGEELAALLEQNKTNPVQYADVLRLLYRIALGTGESSMGVAEPVVAPAS